MPDPTSTAVIFDVGHVLYDWDPHHLYARHIPDPARLDWFLANVVTREWHFQHDAGRPSAETTAELIAEHPAERALIEAYAPRWLETIPGPVPGSLALVQRLAARGVPLYAITNFSREKWAECLIRFPFLQSFDGVVVSAHERMLKPERAIYEVLLARYGLKAGDCIFVDDSIRNVEAARSVGMQAVHFVEPIDLRAQLRGLGANL